MAFLDICCYIPECAFAHPGAFFWHSGNTGTACLFVAFDVMETWSCMGYFMSIALEKWEVIGLSISVFERSHGRSFDIFNPKYWLDFWRGISTSVLRQEITVSFRSECINNPCTWLPWTRHLEQRCVIKFGWGCHMGMFKIWLMYPGFWSPKLNDIYDALLLENVRQHWWLVITLSYRVGPL